MDFIDTQRVLDALSEVKLALRCAVCLSTVDGVVSLPCHHYYCRPCVMGVLQSMDKRECPLCKQAFTKRQVYPCTAVDQVVKTYVKLHRLLRSHLHDIELPMLSQDAPAPSMVPKKEHTFRAPKSVQCLPGPAPKEVRDIVDEPSSESDGEESEEEIMTVETQSKDNSPVVCSLWSPSHPPPMKYAADRCHVCFEDHCPEENPLVYCEQCDIGVHQHCYGITTIPLGPWLCVSCSTGVKNPSCAYCPNKDDRAFHKLKRGGFVHTSCAFWCPELRFASKEGIGGLVLGKPLRQRLSLKCCVCKSTGLCLQCEYPKCFKSFHVPCAARSDMLLELREQNNTAFLHQFCLKHAPMRHEVPTDNSAAPSSSSKRPRSRSTPSSAVRKRKLSSSSNSSSREKSSPSNGSGSSRASRIVILHSKLNDEQQICLANFAARFGARLVTSMQAPFTHVVMAARPTPNGFVIKRRTLKYFIGIVSGAWVVSIEWVQACFGAGGLVSEAPFEIRHDGTGADAARKGRRARQTHAPALFDGWSFVLPRPTEDAPLGGDLDFQDTLSRAGANVIRVMPEASHDKLVLLFTAQNGPSRAETSFCNRTGALLRTDVWALNLISRFERPSAEAAGT